MKNRLFILFGLLISVSYFQGCDLMNETDLVQENPGENLMNEVVFSSTGLDDPFLMQLASFENVNINEYTVSFKGRATNLGKTTFHYSVTGNNTNPQLDRFQLELPACAGILASRTPTQSSKLEGTQIIWEASVSGNGSQDYSITFDGDVPLGIIEATVVRGGRTEKAMVVGPCSGVSNLSGSIFIDANEDGQKSPSESGLAGFPITLINNVDKKVIGKVLTSSDGNFSIKVLTGSFTIQSVDELLNKSYNPSTPNSIDLGKVTADQSGINFGYLVNSSKIVAEIEQNIIQLNTEPASYWEEQISQAGKRRSNFTVQQINGLLSEIEGLLLPEPFQFGTNKISAALAILQLPKGKKAQDDEEELSKFLRQLLAAELNVVSGRGAITIVDGKQVLDKNFNDAILILGEAIACEELGACTPANGRLQSADFNVSSRDLIGSTTLLTSFNGTGGVRQ